MYNMAPSILLNQEDQACRILLEASRSRRNNISDGKKRGIKRVSFTGLNLNSTNKEEALSIRKNTDTSEGSLQKVVPVCHKVRLVKKKAATTSDLTRHSARGQTLGNSNTKYPNIAELNITDSSNVRRNNKQEYSRCPILRQAETSSLNQLQHKSNTKMSFEGLYWRMPKPGDCHSSSRQLRKHVVHIQGKFDGKTGIDKSTHSMRQSPISKRASNLSRKRKNLYGRRLKRKAKQRTVKLPAFVQNSQRARKTKISNMLLRSSELSAFCGNEALPNHTEDFQQYIQLTRSRLHPCDVERIRKDGSPVDLVASNSRSNLQNGHVLNIAYRHFTDSKEVINCPGKQKHSSLECPCCHEKYRPTKQRDTVKSNKTQQKGHICEKCCLVEGQLNRNSDERLEKGSSSKREKLHTKKVLGPTSAKQLQYKLVLGSHTPGERTYAQNVDPARATTVKGNLHIHLNSVPSSQTGRHVSPTMSSSLLSVQLGQTSSNQIVEWNKYANVQTKTNVIVTQTAREVESADVSRAGEFPTFAAQRRNAAYLAYAKTGRRAKLLGDVIEVVRYDEDSPLPSTGDGEVVRCDEYSSVPSRGDSGNGVSDISVHTPQSGTANSKAKIDSRANLKPKSRNLGGRKKRCSQSTMTAKSKLQGGGEKTCNVTENSSTGRRSARRVSQKKPMNRKPTRKSLSQKSQGTRKSGCSTSKQPRRRRRLKLVACGQKPPVVCSRPRTPGATSRRRSNPSQRKYRRKSPKVKGNASHNANIKLDDAKRKPTKKVEQINQLNESPNNKCKSKNITIKKCDYVDKPQQDLTKQHVRPKLRKCKRRRRRKKKTKHFMKFKQTNSNSKELNRKTFPQAKSFQTKDQIDGYNRVKSGDNWSISANYCLNANIYGEDDSSLSDASGGLFGTLRLGTLGFSSQELDRLANCLVNPLE